MRGRRLFLALAACAAALPALSQPASVRDDAWFFVQITDPQLGQHAANRDFEQEAASLELTVATINRWKPRFVVVTGDLVNNRADAAQVAAYKRIITKIDKSIPKYELAGNHDVDDKPTPASVAWYRETYGPDHYSFRAGSFAGVVLNSTILTQPDQVPALVKEQRSWLEQELAKLKAGGASPIVVFQHHPWFVAKLSEPNLAGIPEVARRDYVDLLTRFGVKHVFSGHVHRNFVANDGGLEVVTTSAVGMPRGTDHSGVRVVVVSGGEVRHTFHPFGRLPNRIEVGR